MQGVWILDTVKVSANFHWAMNPWDISALTTNSEKACIYKGPEFGLPCANRQNDDYLKTSLLYWKICRMWMNIPNVSIDSI